MNLQVNIINNSSNALPEYETGGAAGMDVKAFLTDPIELKPLERALVPTGLFVEIPTGYEAQIRPRSGLAIKLGITCLNTPGTIDSDYRGEIKIILINLSAQNAIIHNGDRIAQMVIQKVERITWQAVEQLSKTNRNQGGFGSTGKN